MNDDQLRAALTDLVTDLPQDDGLPAATARRAARRRGLKQAAVGTGALAGVGLVLSLVLVGGGAEEQRLVPAGPPPTSSPAPTPSSPEPSTGATSPAPPEAPSSAPVPSTEAPAAPLVVLRPDGLGFAAGSASSSLAFGVDGATVRAAVDRALGAGGELATPDCGEGSSSVQYEGLFLLLQDGTFVGWTTGSPGLTTGDGVGVGTSLADLRAALPALELSEGTVGVEFSTAEGGLAGFLDGDDDSSRVTSLGAGTRCVAR